MKHFNMKTEWIGTDIGGVEPLFFQLLDFFFRIGFVAESTGDNMVYFLSRFVRYRFL